MCPHLQGIRTGEDSHKTLKAQYERVSYATVKRRKLLSYKCLLNNWFLRTIPTIGFHSQVLPRDDLVTLRAAVSPGEVERREEALQVTKGDGVFP